MTALTIAVVVAAVILFVQAAMSLQLMLYTWDDPRRLRASRGARQDAPPRLSFSVLVPAREEEAVIGETLRRVAGAHYPRHLLEFIVICHAADKPTIDAASHAIRELGASNIRVVTFGGVLQNKPRALNAGLLEATNTVVGVLDAEDDIHPGLFSLVNSTMITERVRVVQAGVQLINFWQHWFSIHNCLEYFFWFRSRLHFQARIGAIPLGGNTVFIARTLLEQLGGWDERCLTEDADIGIRLSTLGERIRVIYDVERVTREETPHGVSSLIRQRTRWHHGFLQVLAKRDWMRLGTPQQRILALYTLSFPLLHAALTLLWPFVIVGVLFVHLPLPVAMVTFLPLYPLVLQLALNTVASIALVREYGQAVRWRGIALAPLTFLPYQWLLGVAAIRAVYRFAIGELAWEKTEHVGAHRSPLGMPLTVPHDLLQRVLHLLPADRASLMIFDHDRDAFVLAACRGLPPAVHPPATVAADGVAGWAVRTWEPLLINGSEIPQNLQKLLRVHHLHSSIVLPIAGANDKTLVISVGSSNRELGTEHLAVLVAATEELRAR